MQAMVLIAESKTVAPGGVISVPVKLNKVSNIGSMNFTLTYDPTVLRVIGVTMGSLLSDVTFVANYERPSLVHPMGSLDIQQHVVPLDFSLDKFGTAAKKGVSGSGSVAHIRFRAIGAKGSRSPLTLSNVVAKDSSGRNVVLRTVDGVVTIQRGLSATKNDYFARAQFEEVSDAQKLNMPSFEKMNGGVSIGDLVKVVCDYIKALNDYNSMLDAETTQITKEIIRAGERVEELHKKWHDIWCTYRIQQEGW